MGKSIIWSGGRILIAVVLGLVQDGDLPSRFRSKSDGLQATPVDLGVLRPGETREFKVLLRNTGFQPIPLLAPKSDCGCLYHDTKQAITIPAEGSLEIPFSLRAPPWPGDLNKKITLVAGDGAGATWQVPVTARVVAKAWAVPPSVDLSCDQATVLEPSVVVYHDVQTRVSAVVSSSPAITVAIDHRAGNRVQVDLTIQPPPMRGGETWEQSLQVFDQKDQTVLLTVPVHIACPPELQCIPAELVLNGTEEPGNWLERRVLLVVRSDVASVLEAQPLCSWVHVESLERTSRGFSVRLHLDKKAMPANFHEKIIGFALKGKGQAVFLSGLRQRDIKR
jgi:hypothetical protein